MQFHTLIFIFSIAPPLELLIKWFR